MDQALTTSFDNVCDILADIWAKRDELAYSDFFNFNLLGVTLAYAYSEELIDELSPDATDLVEEAFESFLDEHEIDDVGFNSLAGILKEIKENE
jgi:hypothetical protein